MKTKRIINAAIWAAISISICIMVCVQWHAQGCGIESMIAAIAFHTCVPFAIGYTIDAAIQGK